MHSAALLRNCSKLGKSASIRYIWGLAELFARAISSHAFWVRGVIYTVMDPANNSFASAMVTDEMALLNCGHGRRLP
jgi:hypothetical protein